MVKKHNVIADLRGRYPYGVLYGSFSPNEQDKLPDNFVENTKSLLDYMYLNGGNQMVKAYVANKRDSMTFETIKKTFNIDVTDVTEMRKVVYAIVKENKEVIYKGIGVLNEDFMKLHLTRDCIDVLNSAGIYRLRDLDVIPDLKELSLRLKMNKKDGTRILPELLTKLNASGYDTKKFGYAGPDVTTYKTTEEELKEMGCYKQKNFKKSDGSIQTEFKKEVVAPKKTDVVLTFNDKLKAFAESYEGKVLNVDEFTKFKKELCELKMADTPSTKKTGKSATLYSDQYCRILLKLVGYTFSKVKGMKMYEVTKFDGTVSATPIRTLKDEAIKVKDSTVVVDSTTVKVDADNEEVTYTPDELKVKSAKISLEEANKQPEEKAGEIKVIDGAVDFDGMLSKDQIIDMLFNPKEPEKSKEDEMMVDPQSVEPVVSVMFKCRCPACNAVLSTEVATLSNSSFEFSSKCYCFVCGQKLNTSSIITKRAKMKAIYRDVLERLNESFR